MKKMLSLMLILALFPLAVQSQNNPFANAYAENPLIRPGLLEAWSFSRTRMQNIPPDEPQSCSGMPLPFGIMGLFEDGAGYFRPNASLISQLSGMSMEELKSGPQNQVIGVARAYQAVMQQVLEGEGGSPYDAANIRTCLHMLSEIPDSGFVNTYARDLQAYEVFRFLRDPQQAARFGFTTLSTEYSAIFGADNAAILGAKEVMLTETGIHAGNKNWLEPAAKSSQYGPAIWNAAPSCNYSSRNGVAVSAIVIHTIQGSYAGAISWSQNCSSNVSYHYVIRSSDGQVTQMVLEGNKAWHVGSENSYTIGYEHEGYVGQTGWYTQAMYESSADLSRDIVNSGYGIPALRTYYGASSSGTQTLGGCTKIKGHQHYPNQSHTDPGIYWDWEKYYRLINNGTPVTSLTAGSGLFTDSGGSSSNYQDDERKIWKIQPAGATSVTVSFTSFSLEQGYDKLFVYDGSSINAPLIGTYTGTTSPGTITGNSGALTFEFRSDCATTASGWAANWSAAQNDITPPLTVIQSSALWKSGNWTASFQDTDGGSGVAESFFLAGSKLSGYSGWKSNWAHGFLNEDFQDNMNWWTSEAGNYQLSSGTMITQATGESNSNCWASVTQNDNQPYLYHWTQKITSSGSNQRAGLHFFCDDPTQSNRGNSYFIYFRESNNKVQIYKVVNDSYTLETDDDCTISQGVTYDIKVTFDPQNGWIRVWCNDVKVSEWQDSSPHTSGSAVSFRTGNCAVQFDNMRVYRGRGAQQLITVGPGAYFYQESVGSADAALLRSMVVDNAGNWSDEDYELYKVDWTPAISAGSNESTDGSLLEPAATESLSLEETGKEIRIWPNPVSAELHIDGLDESTQVLLYDLHGKLLRSYNPGELEKNTIDLSELPQATYKLILSGATGTTVHTIIKR